MTNARKVTDGPVHRRYCGDCGTRIDQLCPKCYTAVQAEPSASLREAVDDLYKNKTMKRLLETVEYGKSNHDQVIIDRRRKTQFTKAILSVVGPVVEAREKLLRYFLVMVPRHEYKCACELCKKVAETQALIGGDDG